MEQRELKVIFNKSGGTAGKNSTTARVTIPNKWVKEMGLSPENREVLVEFDNKKITIQKK